MKPVLVQILNSVTMANLLEAALLGLIGVVGNFIREHTKSVRVQRVTDALSDAADDAVRTVAQTYTDAIKEKKGSLTEDEQREALRRALAVVKTNLGTRGVAEVQRLLGSGTDVDQRLISANEAAHHPAKQDAGPEDAVPAPPAATAVANVAPGAQAAGS